MTVADARAFAVLAHADQRYGDHPYVFHLDAVARLAAPYGEQAQIIAYLHDVVEDTPTDPESIQAHFGAFIKDCVLLLTDSPGSTRQARKALTYARMARANGSLELALIVKAADRLANVRACVADDERERWVMYRDEQAMFRAAAYRAGLCEPLWVELEGLLVAWRV